MTKKASINAARESFSTGSLGKFWFYANLAIFVFIICLAVLPSRIFAADQGLTGYWPMDEATTTWDGAGDRVNDYSGLGNNGTAYGHAHATTTAVYGNAGEFDGTDDYVYLGDTGNNFGTTQTVSAWIYPRVITGNNFRIYATGSGSAYPYTIGIYNGALIFADRNNVNDILYSSIPLVLNTWQYITVVTTGSQAAAKLYINGVDRTGAQGGSGFIFSTITNIGSRSGAVSFFNGLIDDLKVYNYVLTPWQIAQEYNGGKPIAYYKMDEATTTWDGAGDRVNDYSGLGNNGTAYGHAHATTTAVYGNAAEFDGTDDYVHLGDTGNNFGTTQTVSAWIYPRVITGNNFRIYATGSGSAYPYTIGIYGNLLIFADKNNVSDALYSSIPLVLNTWQYITVVTTGSQAAAKLYINGVDRTGAQGGSGFIFSTITNIGSRSGAVSFFNGLIDDLKVYNYVLTPWQIAQEYNNIIVLTAVSAPTFGAVATSSIEVIKPLTAAENIADLYQWQVKRNNAVELGFIATSTTSITDFSLLENTPYIYTVQFKDNANNFGSYGIAATKYTLTNVPVNITVSANNSVTVNSFPNDTLDSSGYYFEDTTLNTNSGWIQTNVWNDGGLLCGSNYNFFVKYRNGDGAETEAITLSQTMGACSESSSGGGSSNNQPTAQPIAVPSNQTVVENQQPDINPAEVKVISPTLGEDLVLLLNQTRNQELETAVANGLKVRLSEISSLTLEQQQTLSNFIVYGTVETKKMGLGERAGSVYSFDSAFNKLPQTEQDWSDVLKICLGRLPNQRSEVKEEQAKTDFNKIYLKEPAVNSQQDQTTLNIMSYGIRPVDRNLSSEIKAADYFKTIYNELPQTTNEWDLMRAISYGGATR